jgi:hypothetical protein
MNKSSKSSKTVSLELGLKTLQQNISNTNNQHRKNMNHENHNEDKTLKVVREVSHIMWEK